MTDYSIHIEDILRSKMGDKVDRIPRFAIAWLRHILHEDWLNVIIRREGETVGVPWLKDCVAYVDMHLHLHGEENFPEATDGRRFTFVSNHPLGGIDGVALGSIIGERYDGRIKYLVNDLLMNLHGLAPFCIPINKTGKQSRDFPAMVKAGFDGDDHIIMFPAGLCSRRIDGKVQDLPWRKTFITKSVETQRDVVPIHFGGQNSRFFYTLANVCKRLGIKANLAMLFLVDELYKNRGGHFDITIGRPIPWQTFTKERTPAEWAAYVRQTVYSLSQE